jgi:hypothetical protein
MSPQKIYHAEKSCMMRQMLKEANYVTASLRPLPGARAEGSEKIIRQIVDNTMPESC